MTNGISRRAALALGAVGAWSISGAQQEPPGAAVWVDAPRRPLRVVNLDYTGIGYLPEPFDYREAKALHDALGRFSINLDELFMDGIRAASAASRETEGVAPVPDRRSANIEMEPRVLLYATPGDRARMVIVTSIDVDVPGVRSFGLDCRSYPVPLPNKGEGSWTDDGFRTLKQTISRCARDITILVQAELKLRRAGLWKTPVEMDRMELIESRFSSLDPIHYEGLVIWETDAALAYAVAHGRGMGHLRNIRHIIDKALVTKRGPA